jgi:hypothetical protein
VPLDDSILGQGVYTPREAARLVGRTPQQVLRWTRGSGTDEPLWHAHYQFLEDSTEISFLDLIEVRVVSSMRSAGISMQAIRFAIRLAREKYGIDRPLASQKFKTDGRSILMDAVEEDGEYVSLSSKFPGQKVFRDIVDQSLNDLEYQRFFGDPLLDEYGISTNILFQEYQSFKDFRYLSSIYEIPIESVKQAISFEVSLNKQQNEIDGKSSD